MQTQETGYVLPRDAVEYGRLRRHARLWEPQTPALLDMVGLSSGARCLDAGCGPGEAMRLMAERVGPRGHVAGIDVDAQAGRLAVASLHAIGHRQCAFTVHDVDDDAPIPGGPYDVVFARLLLLHVDDEVAVLRRLWDAVLPGGHLVVQEYDILSGEVAPALESVAEFKRVVHGTLKAGGSDLRLGLRLASLFVEAGIGAPDGIDAAARIGSLATLAQLYEDIYRAVLPAALEQGVTTADRRDAWLDAFARDSALAGHTALWPLMIGTWKVKT
jgi:ubiquinone/menaquinone biosynthesis C-methylase UbiE